MVFGRQHKHLLKVAMHFGAHPIQCDQKAVPIYKAHAVSDALLIVRLGRQGLGLLVVEVLQPMLKVAQEHIAFLQFVDGFGFHQPQLGEGGQGLASRAELERFFAAAANQLKHLRGKFNFANAARTELDIVGQGAPRHFALNLCVQPAHRAVGVVIEIFAVYKWPHQRLQILLCTGDDLGFNPRVAFPLAALGQQIVFKGVEAHHQRPRIAIRSQTHINAEHKTIGGRFGNRGDEFFAQAGEKFVIRELARAFGVAVFGIEKNQINIGRHIQFAAAELAHADHNQFLGVSAVFANRLAVGFDQAGAEKAQRGLHSKFGQGANGGDDFVELRKAVDVADDQACHHRLAKFAQTLFQTVFIVRGRLFDIGLHFRPIECRVQTGRAIGFEVGIGGQDSFEIVAVLARPYKRVGRVCWHNAASCYPIR